jgi:hypothetical protein
MELVSMLAKPRYEVKKTTTYEAFLIIDYGIEVSSTTQVDPKQ